jgi:hypothetical protein
MVIAPDEDPYVSPEDVDVLERAVSRRAPSAGPGVFWRVAGAGHGMAIVAEPDEYRARLETFLRAAGVWNRGGRSGRASEGTESPVEGAAGIRDV